MWVAKAGCGLEPPLGGWGRGCRGVGPGDPCVSAPVGKGDEERSPLRDWAGGPGAALTPAQAPRPGTEQTGT